MAFRYEEIGQRLKAFRMGSGLGADEIARKIGISRTALYRFERGELAKIANPMRGAVKPGTEPGLEATRYFGPYRGATASGCHACILEVDPETFQVQIQKYVVVHDCGTVINPKIVRGMTMGGIAHGIGAALYEEFAYNEEGQLIAQSFMDYLLPSSHEVPAVEIVHHVTPSPHTVCGQKGWGESGYLGAPAAIASAINDAIRPLGIAVNSLPIRIAQLGDMIAAARKET